MSLARWIPPAMRRALVALGCVWLPLAAQAQDVSGVVTLPGAVPVAIPVLSDYRFPDPTPLDVLTQRNDNNRSGASHWPGINQTAVSGFRRLGAFSVNGVVTAQPLYMNDALVGGHRQPTLFVATSHNDVYAFAALQPDSPPLWHVFLGEPLVNKDQGVPLEGANCWIAPNAAWQQPGTITPGMPTGLVGIEATPVIDPGNGQLLVGFKTVDGHHHLAGLDLGTGRVRKSVTIGAPHAAANPDWRKLHRNRASLLLADGVVYLAFSSLCEGSPQLMHGSIVAFDAATLDRVGEFQVTDDLTDGGGIWQAAIGPAADTRGNLYVVTGNRRLPPPCLVGVVDGRPPDVPNFGHSVLRVKADKHGPSGQPPRSGERYSLTMTVEDFFTPYRRLVADCSDLDLGSAGPLLIPGSRSVVAGGKEGMLYVLDRADMGGVDPRGAPTFAQAAALFRSGFHRDVPDDPQRDRVRQKLTVGFNQYTDNYPVHDLMRWPHIHGAPVFARFGDEAYAFVWPEKDCIKRFRWLGDSFDPMSLSGEPRAPNYISDRLNGMPGGMLSVNVDPSAPRLGVVFASVKICGEPGYDACDVAQDRGILRAYDPFTMHEVWSNRGEIYWYSKFVPPTIAGGRVFLATASGRVIVYGR